MRPRPLIAVPLAAVVLAGCGGSGSSPGTASSASTPARTGTGAATATAPCHGAPPSNAVRHKSKVHVPDGPAPDHLVVKDLICGAGQAARPGDTVTVQYTGVLFSNGKEFDSSWDRGQPYSFQLGGGQVIPGWDRGLVGMRPGGRRELVIPPALAYGSQAQPGLPANSTLVFVVDLVSIS